MRLIFVTIFTICLSDKISFEELRDRDRYHRPLFKVYESTLEERLLPPYLQLYRTPVTL